MSANHFSVVGRRIVVTGASKGIGGGIATRLADAGAEVVVVARTETELIDFCAGHERLYPVVADVGVEEDLERIVASAVNVLGGIDVFVNNAGIGDWKAVEEIDRAWFDGLVAVNLWAPLRLAQLAHGYLCESARTTGDSVLVMIGSIDAVRPSAGGTVYGATKAGLGAMTVALAKEWMNDNIRVVQINAGLVDTPMATEAVAALSASGDRINIADRPGTVDEVAAAVHYVVSSEGRFVNATSVLVDGGALSLGPFDLR